MMTGVTTYTTVSLVQVGSVSSAFVVNPARWPSNDVTKHSQEEFHLFLSFVTLTTQTQVSLTIYVVYSHIFEIPFSVYIRNAHPIV